MTLAEQVSLKAILFWGLPYEVMSVGEIDCIMFIPEVHEHSVSTSIRKTVGCRIETVCSGGNLFRYIKGNIR